MSLREETLAERQKSRNRLSLLLEFACCYTSSCYQNTQGNSPIILFLQNYTILSIIKIYKKVFRQWVIVSTSCVCCCCCRCLVVVLSPISTFSIEQSRKNAFKFGSHVQVMCKSCASHVQVICKQCASHN